MAYVSQQDGTLWRQGGAAAGARALLSVALARGKKTTFAQSGGLLMWSRPNEYLLTRGKEYPGFHFKN